MRPFEFVVALSAALCSVSCAAASHSASSAAAAAPDRATPALERAVSTPSSASAASAPTSYPPVYAHGDPLFEALAATKTVYLKTDGKGPYRCGSTCYAWTVELPALDPDDSVSGESQRVRVMPRLVRWLDAARTTKTTYAIRGPGRARIHWSKSNGESNVVVGCTSLVGKVEAVTADAIELEYGSWYKSMDKCQASKPRHTLGTLERCLGACGGH